MSFDPLVWLSFCRPGVGRVWFRGLSLHSNPHLLSTSNPKSAVCFRYSYYFVIRRGRFLWHPLLHPVIVPGLYPKSFQSYILPPSSR